MDKRRVEEALEKAVEAIEAIRSIEGSREALAKRVSAAREAVEEADQLTEDLKVLHPIFLAVADDARQKIKDEIESVITYGLQSVFESQEYRFEIDLVERRNQVEADFVIVSRSQGRVRKGEIHQTFGGSVVDVISTLLRLVYLDLTKRPGALVMDEPGRMMDGPRMANFGRLLHELCKRTGRQIVCITHSEVLAGYGDRTFQTSKVGGTSEVSLIS